MLFLLLNAEFLAAAQVVVYAGAVMVLYLFVVAYIGGADEPLRPESGGVALFGPLFAAAIAVELCIAFISSGLQALDTRGADVARGEKADLRLARARSASCCSRTSCSRSRPPRSCCWWRPWAPWCWRAAGAGSRTRGEARPDAARGDEPPTETLEVRV